MVYILRSVEQVRAIVGANKEKYILQQGVERPLLVCGGRKYVLRIYVVTIVRPKTGPGANMIVIS